jgi:hypothetical protein
MMCAWLYPATRVLILLPSYERVQCIGETVDESRVSWVRK